MFFYSLSIEKFFFRKLSVIEFFCKGNIFSRKYILCYIQKNTIIRYHLYLFIFSKITALLKYFLFGSGNIFLLSDRSGIANCIYQNFSGNFPGIVVNNWGGGSFFNMSLEYRKFSRRALNNVVSNSLLVYVNTTGTLDLLIKEAKRMGLPIIVFGQTDNTILVNNWKISYFFPVLGNFFFNLYFIITLFRYVVQQFYLISPILLRKKSRTYF